MADAGKPLSFSAASTDITPDHPVPLAGYQQRRGAYEGIADRLEANALALKANGRSYVILSLDLLYVGSVIREELLARLQGRIRPQDLLIAATHTHFAPATDPLKPILGVTDEGYLRFVIGQISALVHALLDDPGVPARLTYREGAANHSVNRRLLRRVAIHNRRLRRNTFVIAPNPAGERDETIRVLSVSKQSGQLACVLWNYACHPAAFPQKNQVSAEFPGVARAALRGSHSSTLPVLFLQGFAGNVRPRRETHSGSLGAGLLAAISPRFFPFTEEAWRRWSSSLGNVVGKTVSSPTGGQAIQPIEPSSERLEVSLGRLVANAPAGRTVSFQGLAFGDDLSFLAMSAEPVVEWTAVVGALAQGKVVIPVGYTDEVFGYLCREEMIKQGGYETEESLETFGLTGPFLPGFETEVCHSIQSVLATQGKRRAQDGT